MTIFIIKVFNEIVRNPDTYKFLLHSFGILIMLVQLLCTHEYPGAVLYQLAEIQIEKCMKISTQF